MMNMKYVFLFFVTAFCALTTTAQNSKLISPKITDVTVFMYGAQITHQGDISLKAGENVFRVTDLPLYMDPNSIQVEGNSNYTIVSVRHQVNYLLDASTNPRVKAIQDSLEDVQFKQKEVQSLRNVMNQERALLESNRSIKGDNSVIAAEDLAEMADFYRERFKQIEYKLLELGEQEKENNLLISKLQTSLNMMNARRGQNPSEVLITVQAQKEVKSGIRFTYFAQNAGWVPVYDLRADDINSPIQFSYRAKVMQSTGTDWEDVNLTISTGNPNIGGQAPMLTPWYVNIYEPILMESRNYSRKDASVAYEMNATPSVAAGTYNWDADKMEDVTTMANYTTIQSNTVSTEFKISMPYDVPSDNQQYDVLMQQETVTAKYNYVTIPKLDNDAFLRAQLTDWMQYSLLPGESNIYFRGTFVGKGYIDPALANDTLTISLGRDRAISIKRDQIKDFCKTSTLGSKQKTTKAYEITITNTKKQAIELVIEDQVPISQNGDIEVEIEEISGGTYDATTGKITWMLTVEPGATVKKQLRFNAKYPKKKYISGL